MYCELKTERLVLRPQKESDLEQAHVYCSDPENTTYMEMLPNGSLEDTRMFLKKAEEEWEKEEPQFYEFSITLNGEVIGGISIYLEDEMDTACFGWILNKKYWKQGYAAEAAAAVKDFAVKKLGMRKLIARCDARNLDSARVMEKIGMMRQPGTEARYYQKTGEMAEGLAYALELE